MATLQEAILSTAPQEVYDKLVTISEDYPVDPSDGCYCPLHEFFVETYRDESTLYDEEGEPYDDVCVSMEVVRIGECIEIPLPIWMTNYQDALMDKGRNITTMGEAVELLAEMYGIERE